MDQGGSMRWTFLITLFLIGCGTVPSDTEVIGVTRKHNAFKLDDLLARGGNVDALDRFSNTPLMIASYNGDLECVKVLLKHGADTQHTDDRGNTAYTVAEAQGYLEIAALVR